MKPVKLAIEGINSFTDRQELDFDAVGRSNLFCICGKTGAGKTTIFDSIMFALYGTSNRGTLADMVNLSLNRARVEFEFISGSDRYAVERTIKCRTKKDAGGAAKNFAAKRDSITECMLYKNGEPIAKGGDATEMLAGVIGLDKDEFKNVYLLEQGEYAEFLKKTPQKQTEAIGKIFSLLRYDEVHKRAKLKAEEYRVKVESLDARIGDIGEDAPELLRAAVSEHASLKKTAASLKASADKARQEIDELSKARDGYLSYIEKANALKNHMVRCDDAKAAFDKAAAELAAYDAAESERNVKDKTELDGLRDKQNKLNELNAYDVSLTKAIAELAQKTETAATCAEQSARAAARATELDKNAAKAKDEFFSAIAAFSARADGVKRSAALDSACSYLDGSDRKIGMIAELKHALDTEYNSFKSDNARRAENIKRISELKSAVDSAAARIEAYAVEIKEITARCSAAAAAEDECKAALVRAQTGSHAAAIRAELGDGDVCPVCGGVYHGGYECGADVDRCKSELEKATAKKLETDGEKQRAERACEKVKGDLERAADELERVSAAVADTDARLEKSAVTDAHGELAALLDNARALGELYADAVNKKRDGEPEAARLAAELDGAERSKREITARIEELRAKLGDDAGRTSSALCEVKNGITELSDKIYERETKRAELAKACEFARASFAALRETLEQARRDCPVDMPEFDEEAYADKKSRLDSIVEKLHECERDAAVKEMQIQDLTAKCASLKDFGAERKINAQSENNYRRIFDITKGKAMLNFVVAEYMAEITVTASEILSELSSGKYTLAYDDENGFTVTDYLSGGGKRKASTLSGGEMFLASLSVAIAIARAQSKGNNAFFFLDEGFGTLDEELIDTVFAALDVLSEDCLVGVISHASALIERMPVCVEVGEATDTHGSTIKY